MTEDSAVPLDRKITFDASSPQQYFFVQRASKKDPLRQASEDNLHFPNTHLSREHACLKYLDGKVYIRDCSSTFGSVLNGEVLLPGYWFPLENDDIVRFIILKPSSFISDVFEKRATSADDKTLPLTYFERPQTGLSFTVTIPDSRDSISFTSMSEKELGEYRYLPSRDDEYVHDYEEDEDDAEYLHDYDEEDEEEYGEYRTVDEVEVKHFHSEEDVEDDDDEDEDDDEEEEEDHHDDEENTPWDFRTYRDHFNALEKSGCGSCTCESGLEYELLISEDDHENLHATEDAESDDDESDDSYDSQDDAEEEIEIEEADSSDSDEESVDDKDSQDEFDGHHHNFCIINHNGGFSSPSEAHNLNSPEEDENVEVFYISNRKRSYDDLEDDYIEDNDIVSKQDDEAPSKKKSKTEKSQSTLKAIAKEALKGSLYVLATVVALGVYGQSLSDS